MTTMKNLHAAAVALAIMSTPSWAQQAQPRLQSTAPEPASLAENFSVLDRNRSNSLDRSEFVSFAR